MLVSRLLGVRERIQETMVRIKEAARTFVSYQKLLTIPGFGPYICALVIATIGDPNRLTNYRQVIRLAGLDLSAMRPVVRFPLS